MGKKPRIDPPSRWKCTDCENWVEVYVGLDVPPTCQNPAHSRKIIDMIRDDKS